MAGYRRVLRAAEAAFPYWVALIEDKCIGPNYQIIRDFCQQHDLSLSRHGHTVSYKHDRYQVFLFALEADADFFCKAFDGERMQKSEKGHGKHWSQWRKGTYRQESASGPRKKQ